MVLLLSINTALSAFRTPRILDLINRIEIVHDPDLDAGGAAKRHAVIALAEREDGHLLRRYIEQRTGSAEHPLTDAQIERKFRTLVSGRLSDDRALQVLDTIAELESIDRADCLTRLLQ